MARSQKGRDLYRSDRSGSSTTAFLWCLVWLSYGFSDVYGLVRVFRRTGAFVWSTRNGALMVSVRKPSACQYLIEQRWPSLIARYRETCFSPRLHLHPGLPHVRAIAHIRAKKSTIFRMRICSEPQNHPKRCVHNNFWPKKSLDAEPLDSRLHYLWFDRVWQPQIRRIWGWLHRAWSFVIPKPSASSGEALRLRLPPRIEPCRNLKSLVFLRRIFFAVLTGSRLCSKIQARWNFLFAAAPRCLEFPEKFSLPGEGIYWPFNV